MAYTLDPALLRTVFVYHEGMLYRRERDNRPPSTDPSSPHEYLIPLRLGDYIAVRTLLTAAADPQTRAHLPPLPARASTKQIIYALHHGHVPRFIRHRDGSPFNMRIENLEGSDVHPLHRESRQKQVPCRYDPETKQIVPITELSDGTTTKYGLYVKKPRG